MDTRGEWEWLAGIYFPVMVAVTVVVVAAFVYPVLRYRRRRDMRRLRLSLERPPGTAGSCRRSFGRSSYEEGRQTELRTACRPIEMRRYPVRATGTTTRAAVTSVFSGSGRAPYRSVSVWRGGASERNQLDS
jgi:hypothetical protein